MSEYIFKLRKGELELELRSNDSQFIESQMETWRQQLLQTPESALATTLPS
jgi:hypothetical protein